MSIFAIGDLHLSLSADKPMDIFGGWTDYTVRLENAWRKLVSPTDTVVVPGDISWAMDFADLKADFAFLQSLPGKKYILKGNHDYWWSTVTKMDAYCAENGFDSIKFIHNSAAACEGRALCGTRGWFYDLDAGADKKVLLREAGRLRTSITEGKKTGLKPLVFLHYPPLFGDYRCDEIMSVLLEQGVDNCYYGHLHGPARNKAVTGLHEGIKFTLVSSDAIGFCPLLIEGTVDSDTIQRI